MIEMVIKVTDVGHLSNGRLQDGQSPGPGELTALLTVFLSGEVFLQNLSLSLSCKFFLKMLLFAATQTCRSHEPHQHSGNTQKDRDRLASS